MKYYNIYLRQYARLRRRNQTYAEMRLWSLLRRKQLLTYKFRRQHITTNHIVDFFCHELKLIIEIDGFSHDEIRFCKDNLIETNVKKLGFTLLRFSEFDVRYRTDDVLQTNVNCEHSLSDLAFGSTTSPKGRGNYLID